MDEAELPFVSIVEAGALLRSGKISAVELTEMMLTRIGDLDGRLNAFMTVTDDLAREQAARADADWKQGRDRGPLHGIPIALKDLFETRGIRTTAGAKFLDGWKPDRDASVVKALAEAGAVCLGKTGMHELAFGTTSDNPHYGAVHNPYKLDHHPGGSSGGSAAAVAAGMAYAALGSDTGCSIRQPAQCCGIVGHKPSFGLVSRTGVVPLVWSLDHVGPMTRTVQDAAMVLQVIAGPDADDPYSAGREPGNLVADLGNPIDGLRLGVPRKYFFEGGSSEVIACVDAALEVFRERGAELVEIEVPDVEQALVSTMALFCEAAVTQADALESGEGGISESLRGSLEAFAKASVKDYVRAQDFKKHFSARMAVLMQDLDALVMPTSTVTAGLIEGSPPEHAKERWKNCGIFDLTGQPAVSIPCGLSEAGLPIGLMICGRLFEDARTLQIANAFERATDFHRTRPPV